MTSRVDTVDAIDIMKAAKIINTISDSYGKYFITLKINGIVRYIVWGDDSTDSGNDKLLLTETKDILLFDSMPEALHYILQPSITLFDEYNIKEWAKACLQYTSFSSITYNVDIVLALVNTDQFFSLSNSSRDDCFDLLNSIHLISDYAYQTNNRKLIRLYEEEYIKSFTDYVNNNYLWTIPKDELTARQDIKLWENNYPDFKQAVLDFVGYFLARLTNYQRK